MRLPAPVRRLARPLTRRLTHGWFGIRLRGHRVYVGDQWEELGRLQFDFLRAEGLRPDDVLLDVACGSLRGGVHFISYLDPGHYLGIDKERSLISAGLRKELPRGLKEAKRPEFVVSQRFEFERFSRLPDVALAQSLFTHLPPAGIEQCLRNLLRHSKPTTRFYATFNESEEPVSNPVAPHDHRAFRYTRGEMQAFGERCGWNHRYIGAWGHPQHQVMVVYTPALDRAMEGPALPG